MQKASNVKIAWEHKRKNLILNFQGMMSFAEKTQNYQCPQKPQCTLKKNSGKLASGIQKSKG